jgi:hypothetical protein
MARAGIYFGLEIFRVFLGILLYIYTSPLFDNPLSKNDKIP